MMPPVVNRGTAGSRSRSPPEVADDGSCGASPRLFSTSARASQSTLASRPRLWYNQLISDSSEPSGISTARRTKPRERTYAFSLYNRLLMIPSSVPRSLSYAGSQNQLFPRAHRLGQKMSIVSAMRAEQIRYARFFHKDETLNGNKSLK